MTAFGVKVLTLPVPVALRGVLQRLLSAFVCRPYSWLVMPCRIGRAASPDRAGRVLMRWLSRGSGLLIAAAFVATD
jgi:hypothetical protein